MAAGCASAHKELDLPLIVQAWDVIQHRFVQQSAVDPKAATYEAISGLVDSLGDTGHSTFLTPEMLRRFNEAERGELKGIGVEIQMKDGHVVIVAPLDDSPARSAGLRSGDFILKVNQQDISDWPLSKVADAITGPTGTRVKLTIRDPRGGRTREVAVMRATIKLREVTWLLLPGTQIVHLRIASFDAGVTKNLRAALATIQDQGAKGIILDLRDNPGGLLDEAVGAASQFLESGNVLLAKDAKGHITPVPVEKGGLAPHIPVVVLINIGTGSAAEIVAAALRDADRATLVGESTFGTGTVLEEFRLADGSALLLAVQEWLTPAGHSFWHKGLAPTLQVALPDEATPLLPEAEREMTARQLESSDDRQLLRALELVREEAERRGG
jgi:carboxyl-terminal processing protease